MTTCPSKPQFGLGESQLHFYASLATRPILAPDDCRAECTALLQAVSNNGYGGSNYGGSSGGGGKVGVTEATSYSAEGGNQLPANDIHLDNSASNFVIGPDGKVPSLASQVRWCQQFLFCLQYRPLGMA